MSEKNQQDIIRQFYEDVFTAGALNIAAIDHYLAADFVGHDLPPGLIGREGFKRFVGMFAASFNDTTQIEVHEMISSGDKVVVRWSGTGRHSGEFMGIPATGRRIRLKGIDIFHLTGDKIADLWQEIAYRDILTQLCGPAAGEQTNCSISR